MNAPAIRSNVERTFFGLFSELPTQAQQELAALADPTHYEAARTAPLLGWTPLSHAVGLRDAVRRQVGDDDRLVALMQEWAVLSIKRPPFKIISEAILRIYARRPGPLLRAYARVWTSIYRNVAHYSVEQETEDSARVVLRDPCPEAQEPAFRLYNLGVFRAVVEIGGGQRPRGSQQLTDGRIEFEVQWGPRL